MKRLGVVVVMVAAVVLIGATFSDWYLVTATGRGFFAHDATLLRAAVSPWDQDRPRAIAVSAVALAAIIAAVLAHVEKLKAETASIIIALSSLIGVGVFVTKLGNAQSAEAFTLSVQIQYLPGFFVGAAAAAALVVAAGVHLASSTLRASASS